MGSPPAAAAAAVVAVVTVAAALLSASAAANPAGGPHMADLSVLLPPRMTKPVEYRLIGGDGCFSWYASRSLPSPPSCFVLFCFLFVFFCFVRCVIARRGVPFQQVIGDCFCCVICSMRLFHAYFRVRLSDLEQLS
jgi:hypothetical protein